MNYFITGIDTGIGKTYITAGIAKVFQEEGKKIGVYKPLQSGAIKSIDGYLAPDIEAVKSVSNKIRTKCTYLLEGEVSPALAARMSNVKIDINKIKSDYNEFSKSNDIVLIEGAGGLLAPVSDNMLCADLIKSLNLPIIVVTVPFLGRLNHTLLTIHYAKTNNIDITGIIINMMSENTIDEAIKHFKEELIMYTDVPILGTIKKSTNNSLEYNMNEFKNICRSYLL